MRPPSDPDFDQNEDRRKRQRTISLRCESTEPSESCKDEWVHQLKAAASVVERSILTERSSHQVSKDKRPSEARTDVPGGANRMKSRAGSDETPALIVHSDNTLPNHPGETVVGMKPKELSAPPYIEVHIVRADGELALPKLENVTPNVTPKNRTLRIRSDGKLISTRTNGALDGGTSPKKALRIHPDGKLGSPKAKVVPHDTERKRGRKPTEIGATLQPLVAVVRYGEDETSRSIIGRNIDDVIAGRKIMSTLAKAQPPMPTEPPKATHPFFLGGAARSSDRIASNSSDEKQKVEANVDPPAQPPKVVSPRKARVTSKPAEFAHDCTGAVPFGRSTFGSDHARISRFPGAMEPIWPTLGMLHVGQEIEKPRSTHLDGPRISQAPSSRRKLKGLEIIVPAEEEVLRPYLDLVHAYQVDQIILQKVKYRDWHELRRPLRRLMTGHALQQAVNQRMSTKMPISNPDSDKEQDIDELSGPQTHQLRAHKALRPIFEQIAISVPAFDRFECETQDWVHKYAPKTAENVLQHGREVLFLRDWLRGLTVTSTESSDSRTRECSISRRVDSRASKRRQKRAEELEGFVVSSDEEANQMDEITDPKDHTSANPLSKKTIIHGGNYVGCSSIRNRSANAVVISGPHGCGKTAAVYAAAQDLGFEVFEINAGSRRSGRDILDKVGDMTRNHLVRHISAEGAATSKDENEELEAISEKIRQDLESDRQGTMRSFFKGKGPTKRKPLGSKETAVKASSQMKETLKKHQSQKQSLILLEEVDVRFEEDKLFWATILDLIVQSKRPIVMTCTDEAFLPLNELVLYAILRLKPPPEQLATDYLLLVACNEGHLLSRDAVSKLYRGKGSDLRASMAELNFFCQMAIGDSKGGLEWMLIRPSSDDAKVARTESLRVVSDGTYQPFMGWFSGEDHTPQAGNLVDRETRLLSEVWNGWGIDVGGSKQCLLEPVSTPAIQCSRTSVLEALQSFDQAAEALSAVDVFPACVCRQPDHVTLEPTLPEVTEKIRSNYVEGSNVLLADPSFEEGGVAESLSLTMRASANRLSHGSLHRNETLSSKDHEQSVVRIISNIMQDWRLGMPMTKLNTSAAFEPIARSTNPVLGIPKGLQISSFDGPMPVIAEDLAPYVRNIVTYDLKLEEQRRQLDSLLSGPGKNGKARTTRSSRAALEGGQKAYTRRERWFANHTNFNLVLQSGGIDWQGALQRMMAGTLGQVATSSDPDETRRSSVGSAMESDLLDVR